MADTIFSSDTVVASTWLQDANDHTYDKGAGVKHAASKISVTPAVTITSTDVQAALEELSTAVTDITDGLTFTGNVNVPSLNGGPLAGHRNRLINGCFSVNQRASASVADDVYCLDRWYVLTETGNITVAQLTDPEAGAINGLRLTQPDASPKRMGFAQIIESKNIRQFASRAMHLGARLRLSTSANIRYAVIEHTGTADVVTSDVVNNWASTTFTPSNFFISGINVLSTGTITPGAATWGDVSAWATLSAGVKNVIVFIWTESQVAQNVTLDCSHIQYEPGVVATPHEWRLNEAELCQRYYVGSPTIIGADRIVYSGDVTSGSFYSGYVLFKVRMRAVPAVLVTNATAVGFPAAAGTPAPSVDGIQETRSANASTAGSFTSTYTASAEL